MSKMCFILDLLLKMLSCTELSSQMRLLSITSYVTHDLVSSQQSAACWTPPSNWTGPSAVFYQNFDSSDGFVLMERTEAASNSIQIVSGKVRYIVWPITRALTVPMDLFCWKDIKLYHILSLLCVVRYFILVFFLGN